MEPTLVILAAGMGSRFGGLKQISPLGPHGEIIIDYSLHDAYEAGFRKVVFVIKEEMYDTFREVIGKKTEEKMQVKYAIQALDILPDGFEVPENRKKPWGTAHAVMCARPCIDGNFGIINADDYYGKDCYKKLYDFLSKNRESADKMELCMVAYVLKNTLTENGTVSRGVCNVENGKLVSVTERTSIRKTESGDGEYSEDGVNYTAISGDTPVSMNVWGFTKDMIDYMQKGFVKFLENLSENREKAEYYLPSAVDSAVKEGKAEVTVLQSEDRWYGVTYAEDKQSVTEALTKMHNEGKYPPLR